MTFSEFLHMGGYGFYVWTSYGICTLVLVANLILPVLQKNKFFRQLTLKQKRNKQK